MVIRILQIIIIIFVVVIYHMFVWKKLGQQLYCYYQGLCDH